MTAAAFEKRVLVLNGIGIVVPLLLYVDSFGFSARFWNVLMAGCTTATALYLMNRQWSNQDISLKGTQQPLDRYSQRVLLLLPIVFGAVVGAAIVYAEEPFRETVWLLIVMFANVGRSIHEIQRTP